MVIQTQGDALQALSGLFTDLANIEQSIVNAGSQSSFSIFGSGDVSTTATSLVTQLMNYGERIEAELTAPDPTTPLTAQQTAQMQELQKEVISDRALINQSISSVDWTFGGIFNDSITSAENLASQAVTSIASSVGVNWTWVAVIVGVVVVFLVWRKVT